MYAREPKTKKPIKNKLNAKKKEQRKTKEEKYNSILKCAVYVARCALSTVSGMPVYSSSRFDQQFIVLCFVVDSK